MDVYEEIREERAHQDTKWGGAQHDDQHHPHDWLTYLVGHLGRAWSYPFEPDVYRRQLIRVAALAVAAIESYDRRRSSSIVEMGSKWGKFFKDMESK